MISSVTILVKPGLFFMIGVCPLQSVLFSYLYIHTYFISKNKRISRNICTEELNIRRDKDLEMRERELELTLNLARMSAYPVEELLRLHSLCVPQRPYRKSVSKPRSLDFH